MIKVTYQTQKLNKSKKYEKSEKYKCIERWNGLIIQWKGEYTNTKDPVYGSLLFHPSSSLLHSDNMLMQTIATEVKNIFWGLAKCLMYNPGQVRDRNCLSPFNVSGVPKMHRRVLGMHGSRSPLQVPHVRYC